MIHGASASGAPCPPMSGAKTVAFRRGWALVGLGNGKIRKRRGDNVKWVGWLGVWEESAGPIGGGVNALVAVSRERPWVK